MQLNAKMMDGKIVKVKVSRPPYAAESPSIRWIKDEIKDDFHLLPEMQQLYFKGQLLEDDQTASFYGIKDGSTLKVIGLRPASVPLHATQVRLLSSIMDRATTAKDDSRKCVALHPNTLQAPCVVSRDGQPRADYSCHCLAAMNLSGRRARELCDTAPRKPGKSKKRQRCN